MELTLTYVLSQVFVIINALLLMATYQLKTRKSILIVSFIALLANGVAYVLLSAWSGLAMVFVAMIRNIIFIIDEKKNGKNNQITRKDIAILIVLYAISIISAVYTYEGFLSLMSVFATMLYTYSVWQKKTSAYKILGIIIEVIWIIYNIYIFSIFGIIIEIILLISAIIGIIRECKMKKEDNNGTTI
ncbi:MAG: YgjV family protein [Clostridiales bacterium]|nr:YgjV family protein [Clostridiales bacterium]